MFILGFLSWPGIARLVRGSVLAEREQEFVTAAKALGVKEFGIILIVSLVGELLNYFLPLPVPASIYGLVLMFLCLMLGVIKLSDVHDTACFLIEIMPIMFIPPAVGLMASWDVIQANLVAYLIIAAVTTIVVMAVSGLVTQEVLKKGKKGAEKK